MNNHALSDVSSALLPIGSFIGVLASAYIPGDHYLKSVTGQVVASIVTTAIAFGLRAVFRAWIARRRFRKQLPRIEVAIDHDHALHGLFDEYFVGRFGEQLVACELTERSSGIGQLVLRHQGVTFCDRFGEHEILIEVAAAGAAARRAASFLSYENLDASGRYHLWQHDPAYYANESDGYGNGEGDGKGNGSNSGPNANDESGHVGSPHVCYRLTSRTATMSEIVAYATSKCEMGRPAQNMLKIYRITSANGARGSHGGGDGDGTSRARKRGTGNAGNGGTASPRASWDCTEEPCNRTMQNVVVSEPVYREFYDDLRVFMKGSAWYHKRGLPYRRSYVCFGMPGTGKTSAITAVSNHFSIPLFLMDTALIEDSTEFVDLCVQASKITRGQPHIFLYDDIDRSDVFSKYAGYSSYTGASARINLGTLLNSLDGASSASGRISILAVNDKSVLHDVPQDALMRPGRIDRVVEFGPCTPDQLRSMMSVFYNADDNSNEMMRSMIERIVPANVDQTIIAAAVTPARVTQAMMAHRLDPQAAFNELFGANDNNLAEKTNGNRRGKTKNQRHNVTSVGDGDNGSGELNDDDPNLQDTFTRGNFSCMGLMTARNISDRSAYVLISTLRWRVERSKFMLRALDKDRAQAERFVRAYESRRQRWKKEFDDSRKRLTSLSKDAGKVAKLLECQETDSPKTKKTATKDTNNNSSTNIANNNTSRNEIIGESGVAASESLGFVAGASNTTATSTQPAPKVLKKRGRKPKAKVAAASGIDTITDDSKTTDSQNTTPISQCSRRQLKAVGRMLDAASEVFGSLPFDTNNEESGASAFSADSDKQLDNPIPSTMSSKDMRSNGNDNSNNNDKGNDGGDNKDESCKNNINKNCRVESAHDFNVLTTNSWHDDDHSDYLMMRFNSVTVIGGNKKPPSANLQFGVGCATGNKFFDRSNIPMMMYSHRDSRSWEFFANNESGDEADCDSNSNNNDDDGISATSASASSAKNDGDCLTKNNNNNNDDNVDDSDDNAMFDKIKDQQK